MGKGRPYSRVGGLSLAKDLGLPGSQTSFLEDVAPPGGQIAGLLR